MALSRLQWKGSEEKVQETESDFQHDGGGREWRAAHPDSAHLRKNISSHDKGQQEIFY